MGKNVYEIMAEQDAEANIERFKSLRVMDYEHKVYHAEEVVDAFVRECYDRELNFHVSVGGLDSITLLIFLREYGKRRSNWDLRTIPAISASLLEDKSIQLIHQELGVESVPPLIPKIEVLQRFGFPVLSKEIAAKIEHLQNPSERNATVRHAIITGETGEFGAYKYSQRMKLSQKWLDIFGGSDPEGAALGYKAAPFNVSAKCCYYLKERPCDDWAKAHHSVTFLGLMASEGGRRAKGLMLHGCNYWGKSATRSCPFAIFDRQDLLQLALDLNVPVPEIYGEIVRDADGTLRTTKAQRTGCSMCGFGIQLEKRPHRFDLLRERNPREWDYWMNKCCKDENGENYGWGKILDYIGVEWR